MLYDVTDVVFLPGMATLPEHPVFKIIATERSERTVDSEASSRAGALQSAQYMLLLVIANTRVLVELT